MTIDETLWTYNCFDCLTTLQAHLALKGDLARQGNEQTYRDQAALIEPLVFMQQHGIRADEQGLLQAVKEVEQEERRLLKEFRELCGCDINPASPSQLAEYFYVVKKYRPYHNRRTKKITTDEKALNGLARQGSPEAKVLVRIRELATLRGTFLEVSLDADKRIRGSFNPVGTESGRLSSSKTIFGTGMNLQNLPSEMKHFLLADPGYVLYDIDLKGADDKVVAYVAPEPRKLKAYEEGLDPHISTASLMFNKPYQDIGCVDWDGTSRIGKYSERQIAKRCNHGLNYGMGPFVLAEQLEIENTQGRQLHELYHKAYPGLGNYYRWVELQLKQDRTLTNPFGRKRHFLDRWTDHMFKQAYSFIPQSTVADKINRHGILPIYRDQTTFAEVVLLNQVHDSLVLEIPLAAGLQRHVEILLAIKQSLEQPLEWKNLKFVIQAECKVGLTLGSMQELDWTLPEAGFSQRLQVALEGLAPNA